MQKKKCKTIYYLTETLLDNVDKSQEHKMHRYRAKSSPTVEIS